jgi:3-oxoacyl-[acyl-carrier protein] reductase
MNRLANRTALVTGGSRGIGRAIAVGFAREGADVAVLGRRRETLEPVVAEIAALGRKGIAVVADVCSLDECEAAVREAAEALGSLSILVNNAGGGEERTLVGEDDPAAWRHVVEVNLFGTYHCTRAALPLLKRSSGMVINVGSGMGHQARPGNSSYNCAKAAQWMFTRCLANEVWEAGVTVNELIPGPVATELTAGIFEANTPHPSIRGEWVKEPEDCVPLAIFLAEQGVHGPTGQSFSLARRPL